jgi:hypothetical protein
MLYLREFLCSMSREADQGFGRERVSFWADRERDVVELIAGARKAALSQNKEEAEEDKPGDETPCYFAAWGSDTFGEERRVESELGIPFGVPF